MSCHLSYVKSKQNKAHFSGLQLLPMPNTIMSIVISCTSNHSLAFQEPIIALSVQCHSYLYNAILRPLANHTAVAQPYKIRRLQCSPHTDIILFTYHIPVRSRHDCRLSHISIPSTNHVVSSHPDGPQPLNSTSVAGTSYMSWRKESKND